MQYSWVVTTIIICARDFSPIHDVAGDEKKINFYYTKTYRT